MAFMVFFVYLILTVVTSIAGVVLLESMSDNDWRDEDFFDKIEGGDVYPLAVLIGILWPLTLPIFIVGFSVRAILKGLAGMARKARLAKEVSTREERDQANFGKYVGPVSGSYLSGEIEDEPVTPVPPVSGDDPVYGRYRKLKK